MKTVARILTRLQGEEDGLFIGALFKGGREYFKPNTIYNIVDIMGTLAIVEAGRATGAGSDNCSSMKLDYSKVQFTWCSDVSRVFDVGKSAFLTEDEWKETQEKYEIDL